MANDIVTRLTEPNAGVTSDQWDVMRRTMSEAAGEIKRLRAEVEDLLNTHRAIRALTWEITRQSPSHLKAWIDIRLMVVNDEEARRG